MKKQRSSIDGFIPRRSGNRPDELNTGDKSMTSIGVFNDEAPEKKNSIKPARVLGQPQPGYSLVGSDIDESLRGIDDIDKQQPQKKLTRRQRRRLEKQATKKRRSLPRRIIKWVLILILVAVLAVGGYTGYKLINAGHSVFQGNILDIFKNQPLKQDSNGRSNFLLLGTSEDDPGHDGANLTDSMLIVSIDQTNKNMYMFSVPRDLYVKYGDNCNDGAGKINAYYICVNSGTSSADEQDRLTKTQKFVGDIFGIDIQYGIHVNHTVIKQAVDAVGGVDVDIEGSNGASGVLDRNFDWRCNYKCYLVKYENGVHHLDGEHALFLSQARGDVAPTYGLGNSNFDREVNQQKILVALKNKAMSTGTLTNLSAITKLIDAFGNNLRTNIQTSEIRTITQVASEIKASDIHSISFIGDNAVMTTDNVGGASVVVPSAGTFDYTDIRALLAKNLSSNPVIREAASIVVLNGTETAGVGQSTADKLTSEGFNITSVGNASAKTYTKTEVYQIGTGNTATAAKLTSLFKTTIKKTASPETVSGDVNFIVIIGSTNS